MKLSDVKKRNRFIGIILAALVFQSTGLDPFLRRLGGVAFSFCVLVLLFFLIPMGIEYLERKFVK
ncbi:MAG: hypothetical protein M0011_04895 [Elusimicrobia bacterium]|nr:hypothetical protein [Elusimicrobiota bacterium]